jgi:PKD repeat protein
MRRALLIGLLALVTTPLAAQTTSTTSGYWVEPAQTPGTDVICTTCPCNGPGNCSKDMKTVGYPVTIGRYVGRYLDSQHTNDFQQPFRTARARNVLLAPAQNRVYFIIGSAVFGYDIDRFFGRVASHETLATAGMFGPRAGWLPTFTWDKFLTFDSMFYAEKSSWDTSSGADGQERLYWIDNDDQGYVYLANTYYGWGILKDDLSSVYQYSTPMQHGDDVFPQNIAALRSSNTPGTRYALISDGTNVTNVFDVSNHAAPVRLTSVRKGLGKYAKSADLTRLALITSDGKFEVYTSDTFVVSGQPLYSESAPLGAGSQFSGVATDGTNFFVAIDGASGLIIRSYVPNSSGSGYHKAAELVTTRVSYTVGMRYADGYLVNANYAGGPPDLRLFKGGVNGFTEVDTHVAPNTYYFQNYYARTGLTGYTAPGTFGQFWDSGVVKRNGHTYLIVTAYGLGDVYELDGSSALVASALGSVGTVNPNRPAGSSTGPFYGDPIGFIAMLSSAQANIQWNFGNPEADMIGADPNTVNGVTGTQVTHRYSGITSAAALPLTRTVTVTGLTDSSLGATTNVTLGAPTPAIALAGHAGVVTAPAQLSSLPIVVGDRFVDVSDGSIESHFDTWSVDGVVTKTLPSESAGVGDCVSSHTLNFDAHYGPYTGSSPNEISQSDLPIGIHAATYSVRPFAPAVITTPGADSIVFTSASRVTADTSVLSNAQVAGLQFQWELLDSANNVLLTGPSGSGTVSPFTVAKSFFTSRGIHARLTLTSPTPVSGSCTGRGMETAQAYTQALNGPDPLLNGDCTAGGPPCSFNVSSVSGVDQAADGWTYAWSVQPNNIANTATTNSTFTPAFTQTGQYTVSVTVTNAIGSKIVQKAVNVTSVTPPCQPMVPGVNVFIYFGAPSGCTFAGGLCTTNEVISFDAAAYNYNFECTTHQFSWDFGDGAHGSGKHVTHSYAAPGQYTVSLTITTPQQTGTTTAVVSVGGSPHCQTMVPNGNVSSTFQGASGCTPGTACAINESLAFSVVTSGYDLNCGAHTYQWNFGDGTAAATASPHHAYTAGGAYTVTLTLSNNAQSVTMSLPVQISNNSCGVITPGQNVWIRYSGPKSACSEIGSSECENDESVAFDVGSMLYDLTCGSPTFSWNFGDNTAAVSGKTALHKFAAAGSYTVTLTLTVNGAATAIVTTVKVIDVHPVVDCLFDFTVDATSVPDEYAFTAFGANGVTAAEYDWDFGDGTSTTSATARQTHLYADGKTYTVTLTVPGTNCLVKHFTVKPRRRAAGR